MAEIQCPLPSDWAILLDKTFGKAKFASPELEDRLRKAHLTPLGTKLQDLQPSWQVAPDDRRALPAPEGTHFSDGFPRHVHASFSHAGMQIHIDHTWERSSGPLHGNSQIHIFVNSLLAGFGHHFGSSLGHNVTIDPAIALLPDGTALLVRRPPPGSPERDRFDEEGLPLSVEIAAIVPNPAA